MELAQKNNGVIINADSMQLYDAIPILTARPSVECTSTIPHELYGVVFPTENWSTGLWLAKVQKILDDVSRKNQTPIIVGGGGLYFFALTKGLAKIPLIKPDIRSKIRGEGNLTRLWEQLTIYDPSAANCTAVNDRARITRALEVVISTGKTIREWQALETEGPTIPVTQAKCLRVSLDRATLHERINHRVDTMIADGAVQEVAELIKLNLPQGYGVMKTIGVKQLTAFLQGELSLQQAITLIKTKTRQYAKRQETWFRNKMQSWQEFKSPG